MLLLAIVHSTTKLAQTPWLSLGICIGEAFMNIFINYIIFMYISSMNCFIPVVLILILLIHYSLIFKFSLLEPACSTLHLNR